jgi:chromosome transmission fidelity protein 1
LLCASLTWLADEKDRARKGRLNAVAEDGVDGRWFSVLRDLIENIIFSFFELAKDWVIEQTRERVKREMEADEREYEERLAQARKREAAMKRMAKARVVKKPVRIIYIYDPMCQVESLYLDRNMKYGRFLASTMTSSSLKMNLLTLAKILICHQRCVRSWLSEPRFLLVVLHLEPTRMYRIDKSKAPKTGFVDGEVEPTCTKVYYASRTHSQLAQILPEMRRLKLKLHVNSLHSSTAPPDTSKPISQYSQKRSADELESGAEDASAPCARTVSLGSRKQLCINDELRANSRDLDESCRELLGGMNDSNSDVISTW